MALLIKSDLSDANASKLVTNLEKDKEDAESLIGVIQDFIDSSKEVLVGDSFDAVRNHMQEYINLLQTRIKIAESLSTAVKNANQTMIDYMGSEDRLDTDELEILRQRLNNKKSIYDETVSRINNYSDKEWESLDTLTARRDTLETEINTLNTKIDLTANLVAKDGSVYSTLMQSDVEMSEFKTNIGGINTISI